MKEVTNGINNIGKKLQNIDIQIQVSFAELEEFRWAMAYVMADGHTQPPTVDLYEDLREIIRQLKWRIEKENKRNAH